MKHSGKGISVQGEIISVSSAQHYIEREKLCEAPTLNKCTSHLADPSSCPTGKRCSKASSQLALDVSTSVFHRCSASKIRSSGAYSYFMLKVLPLEGSKDKLGFI